MAKMIKCKTCGNDIAKTAKVCPHCGAKCNVGVPIGARLLIAFFGLIILFNVFSNETDNSDDKNKTPSNSASQKSESSDSDFDKNGNSSPHDDYPDEKTDLDDSPGDKPVEKSDSVNKTQTDVPKKNDSAIGFGGTISGKYFDISIIDAKWTDSLEMSLYTVEPEKEGNKLLCLIFSAKNISDETKNLGMFNAYVNSQATLPTVAIGGIDDAMVFVGAVASGMEMKAYQIWELPEDWKEFQLNYFEATGEECKQYFAINPEDIV